MFGKIFDSMYDGTISANWKALVTFQQMIVLCDADGVIDMTPPALARRTGIPLEIIEEGIEFLEKPDPYSRSEAEEGRRIIRIDEHRPWGWVLVNHAHYKALQDSDTKRAQTRERVRKHREQKRTVTHGNAQKRHTDTDTDSNAPARFKKPTTDQIREYMTEQGRSNDFASAQSIKFFNYYESVGWKVGKTQKPMKSWKHAVVGWLDRAKPEPKKTKTVAELRAAGEI